MCGDRKLTLGNYMIILSSRKKTDLRRFVGGFLPDVEGLVTILKDDTMRDVRNKAAHDEVLSCADTGCLCSTSSLIDAG